MSKLYMELDAAVNRVIWLSRRYGNLAQYEENPTSKQWLRNELEQICEIGVGPLPKTSTPTTLDDGLYMELFVVKDDTIFTSKVISMKDAACTLTNGLMDGVAKLWED